MDITTPPQEVESEHKIQDVDKSASTPSGSSETKHDIDGSDSSHTFVGGETLANSSPLVQTTNTSEVDTSTFLSGAEIEDENDDHAGTTDVEIEADQEGRAKAMHDGSDDEIPEAGHHDRCTGSPGGSTPPDTPERFVTPPTHTTPNRGKQEDKEESPRPIKKQKLSSSPPLVKLSHGENKKIKLDKAAQDHAHLHEKAKGFRSGSILPSGRYWIGILHPNLKPNDVKTTNNFVWIKAHGVSSTAPVRDDSR